MWTASIVLTPRRGRDAVVVSRGATSDVLRVTRETGSLALPATADTRISASHDAGSDGSAHRCETL